MTTDDASPLSTQLALGHMGMGLRLITRFAWSPVRSVESDALDRPASRTAITAEAR